MIENLISKMDKLSHGNYSIGKTAGGYYAIIFATKRNISIQSSGATMKAAIETAIKMFLQRTECETDSEIQIG